MKKYWISFQMQKSNTKKEYVYCFTYNTDEQWDDYFEESCGGVYRWNRIDANPKNKELH